MNVFTFGGHLGQDAELRQINDTSVLNFSVANNIGYGDKKKTLWVSCALWGVRAEKLQPMLTTGTSVMVYGQLDLVNFEKKDGTEGFKLSVRVNDVLLMGSANESSDEVPVKAVGGPKW